MSDFPNSTGRAELLDVREMVLALWRKKLWLLLGIIVGAVYGYMQVREFQPVYTAYMLVQTSPDSDASGLIGQLTGLKGLSGIVGGGGGVKSASVFNSFKTLISTVTFAERLEEKYDLQKMLYGAGWDEVNRRWRRPESRLFGWKQSVYEYLNMRTWRKPDAEMLANYLGSSIKFEPIDETLFVKILIRHRDPETALFLLRAVYSEADTLLRQVEVKGAKQKRDYLQEKLSTEMNAEIRSALFSLIESVEKSTMMLSGELPFLAKIIEPARIATDSLYTNALRTITLSAAAGGVLMLVVISLLVVFKSESETGGNF